MKYNEIRKSYLDYFKSKGHVIVPSASLIPNDPSLLFTVAGMVPFKNIIQGSEKPFATRVANSQKCIRAGGKHNDLDEVGFDASHHTFFEMLGNWSFGDYFKQESIEMSWEMLTKILKLDVNKIRVTTHYDDEESTQIWKKLTGKDAIRLGDKDNWWSAGDTGPCGPCTEIFYDMGEHIKDDDKRWVEIWNNVFMEYDRDAKGNLTDLPSKNVDTGAGLERWAAILQGVQDNYDTDIFKALIDASQDIIGVKKTDMNTPSFKIIADHMRSVGFAIADGVIPSNSDRGYVIRRILRRAMRHSQMLGHKGGVLSKLYPVLVNQMGDAYPELVTEKDKVIEIIQNEENSFTDMLSNGIKLLDNELDKINNNTLPGEVAFKLFDTFGFPLDLTEMILKDKGIKVDTVGFNESMKQQKERSRADTKGTRTLWESQSGLPKTEDETKYNLDKKIQAKVLSILKNNEFVESASAESEVEVVLDKTMFYGTAGGQVGDSGFLKQGLENIMVVNEAARVGDIVTHKGILNKTLNIGDTVSPEINLDVRKQIMRAHTATHLLQSALRQVLGDTVQQRGSRVAPDSVRFDFLFGRAMTQEEKQETQDLVNKWIDDKLDIDIEEMTLEQATKRGALALFNENYDNKVRVISAGNISSELCGGTHLGNTGEIIRAVINRERSISSGIRRITMSVGKLAD